MTLDRGLKIQVVETTAVSLPHTETAIAIIGVASDTNATADLNKLYLVSNSAQARSLLGTQQLGDTLPLAVPVPQRYGAGKILACRVEGGASVEDNVIAALDLLPTSYGMFGFNPDVIMTPGFSSEAVLAKGLEVADKVRAVFLSTFPPGVSPTDALTTRDTPGVGLGRRDSRLIICYGHLKDVEDESNLEALELHLAGAMARLDSLQNYGRIPSSQEILGVSSTEPAISMSYTDENAQSEMFNDKGVVTINRQPDHFVTWGDRNSAFPEDLSPMSIISVVRVRDRIIKMAEARAQKFLDLESNRRTGNLLATSLNDGLAIEQRKGAIQPGHLAEFLESESDYQAGKLVAKLTFTPYTPVRLIELKPVLSLTISVGG